MKKTYIFYFLVALFSLGYSQAPIVTIDRANIVGPTASGNDPSISSLGLTRGSGVNLATAAAANFTSNSWNATSQAQAESNNEFIQWSVTASASNSIEITEIDIRNRKNVNGPANWQIFYSIDNFATAGIPITPIQTSADTATNYNFNGLSIISGIAETVTFRLYAWNAVNDGGWFRIAGRNAWSGFGIATPGIRLTGTVTTTAVFDTESIIDATTFDPTDNINYTSYNVTSGLNTTNAIKIGEFAILDGGDDLVDADNVGTILTDLEFNISNSSYLSALAIFDGTTNISEVTVSSDTATFSGLTGLTAADNSVKTFDVYATFSSTVMDNEQIQLSITSVSADPILGSTFAAFDAGGAQTSIAGDDNRIEVTVSNVVFDQQPTDSFQFEIMTPFPTIIAVDANGNQDLDYNQSFSVISSGSMDPSPIIYTMTNGLATFDTIVFIEKETVTTLVAFGGPYFAASSSFNIAGPLITLAEQDFDNTTPEWTYTTDVATFDNGWGLDGYYGVIDSAIATPLDNPSFSNNIFGENDLNDEGDNGTTGFATITFDSIDITSYNDVTLSFDWDVHGYVNNSDDARYRLIYDGVNQPLVFLLDGNGTIDTDEGTVTVNIPNSVNTVALQVSVRNNGNNGYSGFDNFKLTSVFDGLLYTDNGWSPNAPSISTGSDNAYVLDGTYNVGTNIEINNLFINSAATTTVSAGQSIVTTTGLVNEGILELNSVSTSYSSLISDNVIGDVVYNRHVNQFIGSGSSTGANDLVSAPVTSSTQTFLALRTANPDIPFGTIDGVPSFLFGPFDNDTDTFINFTAADDNTIISSGIGYRTASTEPTGSLFRFVGNVESGPITTPISVGAGNIFNLVGNPYPSYIELSAFLAANNSEFNPINSGVYGYDGSATDGYTIWNQAYSDANPNAAITPGQGFLIASKVGGGTISFTPAMRTIGTTDDFIAGRSSQNLAHVELQLSKGNSSYNTNLYFNDNASLGMDPGYDSALFDETTPSFALYSHLIEDNLGKDFAAQAVSYSDLNNVTFPLGINIAQGEQAVVSISESDIPEGTSVILEDNVTNTFTNLLESDYTFTPATTLNATGRFYVHFYSGTLGLNDVSLESIEIYTNANAKTVVVKGQLENKTTVKLYDIQGRVVSAQLTESKNSEHSIDVSNLAAGIYVVELQSNSGHIKSQKVIIR
ncbi:T9SS type A sorting domain-containing protein [Winogradskyella schleiferi]|uniref:T9SS type A sorting domain-containing protein n=1 Tax=Winogradskyella schleiferi TaxID=2686078 RepID=UPI0015BDE37F|nr:T9SS type A sorting domain-containing protein [Winogradskyella schleiferi]